MKKFTKSLMALLFCVMFAVMSSSYAFAASNMANVTNFKAKASDTSVTLSWTKVSNATGYQIQQKTGSSWTTLNSKCKNTTYTVENLSYGTAYTFRIRAYKSKVLGTDYSKGYTEVKTVTAPKKVSGVKVTNASGTSLKISWSKATGAAGYQVYRSTDGKKWTKVATTTSTSYTNKSLSYGKSYQYKVRAYSKGNSLTAYGSYSSVVKKTTAIPTPSGLKVSASAYNYITISWTKVADAKDYQIQRSTDGKKWSDLKTTTSTSYKDSKVTVGTTYYYRVRVRQTISKATKVGSYCSAVSKKPTLATVSLSVSAIGIDNAVLSWKAITGADGYEVYYNTKNSTSGWTKAATIKKNSTVTATVKNLTEGKKYYFWVRAYKTVNSKKVYGGNGTSNATIGLTKVTGFSITDISTNSATFKWNSVRDAAGYKVYYSTDGGATWKNKTFTKTTGEVTGLSGKNDYVFRVRAYKGSSYGSYSSKLSANIVPAQTESLYAVTYNNEIRLSWMSNCENDGYKVEYRAAGGTWSSFYTNDTSYTLKNLTPATAYEFKVSTYINFNSKKYIGAEAECTATTGTGSTAEIYWAEADGASSYKLEYYDHLTDKWKTETSQGTYFNGLGEYKATVVTLYRVTALNASGATLYTYEPVTVCSESAFEATANDGNSVNLTWAPVEGAKYYAVCQMMGTHYRKCAFVSTNSVKNLCLPAGDIAKLIIVSYIDKPTYVNDDVWKNFSGSIATNRYIVNLIAPELKIVTDKSAADYNVSVNAQLVYLVSAINKTKQTGNVTVRKTSLFTTVMDSINMGGIISVDFTNNKKEAFEDTIKDLFSEEDLNEKEDRTLKFDENGKASYQYTKDDGTTATKTVLLTTFIEPTESAYAYLYAGSDNSAWKNGFSSVTTTKLSDGTTKIVAKLKKEEFGKETGKDSTIYHYGFVSDISGLDGDDLYHSKSSVGATTITAIISEDGLLNSYVIESPYVMSMSGDMEGISMNMVSHGDYNVTYTFTR